MTRPEETLISAFSREMAPYWTMVASIRRSMNYGRLRGPDSNGPFGKAENGLVIDPFPSNRICGIDSTGATNQLASARSPASRLPNDQSNRPTQTAIVSSTGGCSRPSVRYGAFRDGCNESAFFRRDHHHEGICRAVKRGTPATQY